MHVITCLLGSMTALYVLVSLEDWLIKEVIEKPNQFFFCILPCSSYFEGLPNKEAVERLNQLLFWYFSKGR